MTTLTVSAAARLCGVDRRTLQRAIHAGRLPLDAQHCLSRNALIAAGYLDATPQDTSQDTPQPTSQGMPHHTPQDASQGMPQELEQATALLALLAELTTAITDLHTEVRELRAELRQLPQRRRRSGAFTPHPTSQVTPRSTPQDTPHGTPQGMPHPSPQILGTYDPRAAAARIHTLRRQGLSFVRIAAQLAAEGIPTRYGLPWQHSSVRHLFQTYGDT